MITYGYWFFDELRELISHRPQLTMLQKSKIKRNRRGMIDNFIMLHCPNNQVFLTKTNSFRLQKLVREPSCVTCYVTGNMWLLQAQNPFTRPHLNLYHVGDYHNKYNKSVENCFNMMTMDHIMPKSLGGTNAHSNIQTMCLICNQIKGNTFTIIK